MKAHSNKSLFDRLKLFFIGKARNVNDNNIFHKMTLIAFFAWIGLGSDGLSSSCYGPEESYRALGPYHGLSIYVGIAIAITILIISTSYSQIIKLFPSGGGGYKVATKLLSPTLGMISGS
jgi:amino acid transporter